MFLADLLLVVQVGWVTLVNNFQIVIQILDWTELRSRLNLPVSCTINLSFHFEDTEIDEEMHPHNTMLPPPYFTVGMVFVEQWTVLSLCHTAF